MDVSTVLVIYGAILMSAHGVFTYSSDSAETMECNNSDLPQNGSTHGFESLGESRPYVISFNISEPSFPQHLIKLYSRARRLPNTDYLLYKKGDFRNAVRIFKETVIAELYDIIWGLIDVMKLTNYVSYGDWKIYRPICRGDLCWVQVFATVVKYVQILRVTEQTMCFAVHLDNFSSMVVYMFPQTTALKEFNVSPFLFNRYKNASASELPDVMAVYNGTELSFINATCSDVDDVLYPTLPPATTTVNVMYTKCTIDVLGKGRFLSGTDYYNRTLSKVSAINLTGSVNTVSRLLDHLMAGDFCWIAYPACRMNNIVSLDISYSTLYVEDSLKCYEFGIQVMATPHVIKKFYARKILQKSCILYIQAINNSLCISARHSVCCGQRDIICFKPETIELIDIAENSIEYIDTSQTHTLTGLKVLDISSNHLHSRNGGADINLGIMTSLTEFYCSNNKLKTLTAGIFDELSNLTAIDLSFNKLVSITFRLQHLLKLRLLNLFKNEIILSESLFRGELASLVMKQTAPSNTIVQLNIAENPLICSITCETKAVLTWLLEHETEIRFSPLSCELRHHSRIINTRTLEAVEELCREPLYTGIACFLGTIAAAVVIITALAVYRHRLSLRRERRLLNRIRNFKEDAYRERFPVFLCFSSSNADFVIVNVFKELNRRLQNLLGTNRRCVAFGDADFRPGELVVEEMIHCISRCDVVIVCVSNDFLRSLWCTDEVRIVHFQRKPIILMFLEQVDKQLLAKSILQRYFSAACRAKWTEVGGMLELQPDWNVLCESVVSRLRKHQAEPDESDTLV